MDFYNKYIKISNNDIPDDDEVEVYDKAPAAPTVVETVENTAAKVDDILDDNDVDEVLAKDPDEEGLDVPSPAADKPKTESINPNDVDVEALLADDL